MAITSKTHSALLLLYNFNKFINISTACYKLLELYNTGGSLKKPDQLHDNLKYVILMPDKIKQ